MDLEPNTLCSASMFNTYLQPYYMWKTNFFLLQFLFYVIFVQRLIPSVEEANPGRLIIGSAQGITSNELWATYFCENYQPICVTILALMMYGVIFTDMGALANTVYCKDLFILTDALTLKVVITKLKFHEGWFETLWQNVFLNYSKSAQSFNSNHPQHHPESMQSEIPTQILDQSLSITICMLHHWNIGKSTSMELHHCSVSLCEADK